MKTHRIARLLAGSVLAAALALAFTAGPASADEKADKKTQTEKAEKVAADTARVKVSSAFLNRWKKIQKVTKQRAFETQQTRTVAGVRGAEAEDAVLDQLYFKGGARYPSRVDLKNAIAQLTASIAADPKAETVAEQKYFIAQCHAQLGEEAEAKEAYAELVKNHAASDYASMAKAELEKMAK